MKPLTKQEKAYLKIKAEIFRERVSRGLFNCGYCWLPMFYPGEDTRTTFSARLSRHAGLRIVANAALTDQRRATLDHIIPRSKGGIDCHESLMTMCSTCNKDKGTSSVPEWIDRRAADGRPFSPRQIANLMRKHRRATRVMERKWNERRSQTTARRPAGYEKTDLPDAPAGPDAEYPDDPRDEGRGAEIGF